MKKKPNIYFKEYWIRDDLFFDPAITYCILYVKHHKWWPFWKRAGRYYSRRAITKDLKIYCEDFEVFIKHPVYKWLNFRDFFKEELFTEQERETNDENS